MINEHIRSAVYKTNTPPMQGHQKTTSKDLYTSNHIRRQSNHREKKREVDLLENCNNLHLKKHN